MKTRSVIPTLQPWVVWVTAIQLPDARVHSPETSGGDVRAEGIRGVPRVKVEDLRREVVEGVRLRDAVGEVRCGVGVGR